MLLAQLLKLKEKDDLIENLKIAMQELEDGSGKTEGLRQMIDQVKELSEQKRYVHTDTIET